MASACMNILGVYFRSDTMATRWGCVGAGLITSDFFTAIRETLPIDEHEVKEPGNETRGFSIYRNSPKYWD